MKCKIEMISKGHAIERDGKERINGTKRKEKKEQEAKREREQ